MQVAPHIILVHGLGRTTFDMGLLARRLQARFPTSQIHRFDYQTTHLTLAQATERLGAFVNDITVSEPVSFVGHSLGGIVVRSLDLAALTRAPLHRLVTLGSPHNGATIARFLSRYSLARSIFGPILTELGSLTLSHIPRQLEIGCVIGATGTRIGFFPVFGTDNDGLVLTTEASFPGCRDAVSVLSFHGTMPFSRRLAGLAGNFLAHGSFG
jgi:pimeloyl-ACP methyl ester carboxylesterase